MLTGQNLIIMQSSNMQLACVLAFALVYCLVAQCAVAMHHTRPRLPYRLAAAGASGPMDAPDLVSRCTEKWHNTTLDHFNWASFALIIPFQDIQLLRADTGLSLGLIAPE